MNQRTIRFSRRSVLQATVASAATVALSPLCSFAAEPAGANKNLLFLTKSAGYQHSVIARNPADPTALAHAEKILSDLAARQGYAVTATKDADVFNDPATYARYDAFLFYTSGILTQPSDKFLEPRGPDKKPLLGPDGKPVKKLIHTEKPMSNEGKALFLKAVEEGKGFMGFHASSDSFHSRTTELLRAADAKEEVDPYIQMLGGEFTGHGSQQKSALRVASTTFPGLEDLKGYEMHEEWYGLKNLAPDMHVLLVQDTTTMRADPATGKREKDYDRPPYPMTWARAHGKGRVFYTSMGHREDVWTNEVFQKILLASLAWITRRTNGDLPPNLDKVCPHLVAK